MADRDRKSESCLETRKEINQKVTDSEKRVREFFEKRETTEHEVEEKVLTQKD